MAYATRDEVFLLALSAQAFVVRPRPLELGMVDASSGTLRLTANGLAAADLVLVNAVSGGALPVELSPFTYYSPVAIQGDLFKLALTLGGTAIAPFTSAGSGWSVGIDPWRRLDLHLEDASARIDECLTAEAPPIKVDPVTGKYAQILVGMCARMAARAAVTSLQIENAGFKVATDRLFALEKEDAETRAAWLAGKPINVRPPDQDTFANNGARAAASRCPVPWQTGGL